MEDSANNIIDKNIIMLSRNTPVALVVGGAGFIGSYLVEELLSKKIQVIVVDDFSTGKKENLENAVKEKNFHLVNISAEDLKIDVPRLDYLFIVAGDKWDIRNILALAKEFGAKIAFVSSVNLYTHKDNQKIDWYRQNEAKVAKFATENDLNARIIRLACVYGPRMNFEADDAITRLIQAAISGELQKESDVVDFSSRALFVEDGVRLIIKSIFTGSTALKIFDGALLSPIKVSEIKQVLLDPIWYESRGFEPTELPPWPTPNLEKTMKVLNWKPHTTLVRSLQETISYFKDHEINVGRYVKEKPPNAEGDKKEKEVGINSKTKEESKEIKSKVASKIYIPWGRAYTLLILLVIAYGLILPITKLGWGAYIYHTEVLEAQKHLKMGEYAQGVEKIKMVQESINQTRSFLLITDSLRESFLKDQAAAVENYIKLVQLKVDVLEHSILGIEALTTNLRLVVGEGGGDLNSGYLKAQSELNLAQEGLSKYKLQSSDLPINIDKARVMSMIAPSLTGLSSEKNQKSYLVLLQNNHQLRPGGGVIVSYLMVDFEKGKLKNMSSGEVSSLDQKLPSKVEPPIEIKSDLGKNEWLLKDASFEPDFPSSARQAEWFFVKETNLRIDGVWSLDFEALLRLSKVLGDSKKDVNFSSKDLEQLFNKLFLVPGKNWSELAATLDQLSSEKHIMFYFSDPKLFSSIASQNLTGAIPRPKKEANEDYRDFLYPVEANMMGEDLSLQRKFNLETKINSSGQINHKLSLTYSNPSQNLKAKNRFKLYLPLGTKLENVLWGEEDITKEVKSFSDYGWAGYSVLLELGSGLTKKLVFDYQPPAFSGSQTNYYLNIVKQPGTLNDSLEWKLIGVKEQNISTFFSADQTFSINLQK